MAETTQKPAEDATSCALTLTRKEVRALLDTLGVAASDIWQTARVSEYNLTGKDPLFPSDAPSKPPNPPNLIARKGVDESLAVHAQVKETQRMLHKKLKDV